MRKLILDFDNKIASDTLFQLSCKSPDGVLCPKLERLTWKFDASHVPLSSFRLFFSPHLKHVDIFTHLLPQPQLVPHLLAPLTELISSLPTSLEHLSLMCSRGEELLKDPMSSFVCRSGPSLTGFGSSEHLSEAAFTHLMRLPNLRSWVAFHEPPRTLPLATFPPLEELRLNPPAGLPWLRLLAPRGDDQSQNGLASPPAILDTNIKETLKHLRFLENTLVVPVLLPHISSFRNLVTLHAANSPCDTVGESCLFRLSDRDVENLVVTLPSLVSLRLGEVCGFDACATTVSSLLSISIHCLGLTLLETHFDTRSIVSDMKNLLSEGSGHDKPRCKLQSLLVGLLSLPVLAEDVGTVAMGFAHIFPCMKDFSSGGWDQKRWERVASELALRD
jgi:hypothetical protein